MKEYSKVAKEMLAFVEKSPSCFQAIDNLKAMFAAAGFEERKETESWSLESGKGYFVTRNDSSVIAFRLPEGEAKGFHMVASHSDSPTFKIKESPECVAEGRFVRLNTEGYGGMIYSSWLDRPLSVAGRIVVQDENGLNSKNVNVDKDLLLIPNVAIHMNREINKGFQYNPQVDLLPLFGECEKDGKKPSLMQVVAKAAGVKAEAILGHDLFLYTREKGRFFGANDEFILSPRLDDLQCAFSSAKAFAESTPENYINICAVFDNEEVGSGTKQGADSTFLEDTLVRISEALSMERSDYLKLVAGSFLISADNAHSVHPAHPEKADPTNRPYMNGGVVIKYHGSQKYTTDAVSAAKMKSLCQAAGAPFQTFANRADLVGGSTLGNISTSHVSVSSMDIGLPQLAMHSAVETAGAKDTKYLVDTLKVFYAE